MECRATLWPRRASRCAAIARSSAAIRSGRSATTCRGSRCPANRSASGIARAAKSFATAVNCRSLQPFGSSKSSGVPVSMATSGPVFAMPLSDSRTAARSARRRFVAFRCAVTNDWCPANPAAVSVTAASSCASIFSATGLPR